MKRTVGLVILTNIKSLGGLVAILQIRGEFNNETMKPETWPGGCQLAVHGSVHEYESLLDALLRETDEELGREISLYLHTKRAAKILKPLDESNTAEIKVRNFVTQIPSEYVELIQLHGGSGGLRFIRQDQVSGVVNLKDFDRKTGVTDRRITAMFPDDRETLRLAFGKADKLAS